jgi:hypothetical protein
MGGVGESVALMAGFKSPHPSNSEKRLIDYGL